MNEYNGRYIPCGSEDEVVSVSSSSSSSSLSTPACPVPGEVVIANLGINGITESYWFNVGMMIFLQIVFRFAAYYSLRYRKTK